MVEVTRLALAHPSRHATDPTPGTIDQGPVNQGLIAPTPKARADQTRTPCQHLFIEGVQIVFVVQQGVQRLQHFLNRCGPAGFDHVQHIGRGHASHRQPKRRRAQGMDDHGQGTMKRLGQAVHRVVLVAIDGDGIGKEVTKQQRIDGEKPNHDRRDGQQNQRQSDHPRRLVGRG